MSYKYYTQFVLEDASGGDCTAYNGVVELDCIVQHAFDPEHLEEMLATNLSVNADDITILHWSMLH